MIQEEAYHRLMVAFNLPDINTDEAYTTIQEDETRELSGWQVIWTLGRHIVIQTHPQLAMSFRSLLRSHDNLTMALIQTDLNVVAGEQDNFYSISSADRVAGVPDYAIRQLGQEDETAFTAFLAQCSERDRQYGEVSMEDEVIYGAFDGKRIASVASTFNWHDFVDFGVLTDPAYRQQGLGKAVISALVRHYLTIGEPRPLLYRHETSNAGSKKIADAVGWKQFATADYVRFKEGVAI